MSHPNPLLEGISDDKPQLAPSDDTSVKRPPPPRPNSIRSLDQSDLGSAAANPLLADIDTPSKNPLVEGVQQISNSAPSPNHTNNEITLNLLSLTPYATGEDAIRRRANMLVQISQVPEGSFKKAVFKATGDIIKSLNDIFERTPLATATDLVSKKKSFGDIANRYKEDIKSSAKGVAGLAKWGYGAGKGFVEKGPVQGSQDFAGGIVHSFITDPVNRVFGAAVGVDAATSTVLSPEERADDVKFTTALAATSFTGKYITSLMGEGITEIPLLSQGGTAASVPGRTLGNRFLVGTVEGAASGTIFGAISRAGAPDSDYFAGIVTDALMFGSFGSTLNMLAGKRPTIPENMDAMAMATRLLQTHEESTLGQVANNTQAVLSSQNIIEAAIKGQLGLAPDRAHIFTGLKNGREIMDALGKGAHIRSNGKGGWDLLYIGKELLESGEKLDVEMWHRTGFMSGQTVSLGGHEYKIVGEGGIGDNGVKIRLQDKSGVEVEMPASSLRNIPGSEFRGRNQAVQPNTIYSGVAYRGTQGPVDPLKPGYRGNTFMSEDPVFATIHSDKGGAVHRIEYKFKNPKQIPEPPDLATRQEYLKTETQKAYEEGHDGLFIGELGSERLEIIDVTNDKTGLSVKERVDRSMLDADDIDFYMKDVKPRMDNGMGFHDAVLDALGLTAEEVAKVKSTPESDLIAEARVRVERDFERNPTVDKGEPFVDNGTPGQLKDKYSSLSDFQILGDIQEIKDNIDRLGRYGPNSVLSIKDTDIITLNRNLKELEREHEIRQAITDKYKNLSTAELEKLRNAINKSMDDIQSSINDLVKDNTSSTSELLEKQGVLADEYKSLLNKYDELDFILNKRSKAGTGPMLEFKRRPDSALKDTKVLDEHGNAKIVYHGTGRSFSEFDLSYDGGGNLKGPGIYFTENANIANGYAEGRATIQAHEDNIKQQKDRIRGAEQDIKEREEYLKRGYLNPEIDVELNRYKSILADAQSYLAELEDALDVLGPNIHRVKLDIKNPFDSDKIFTREEANRIIYEAGGPPDYYDTQYYGDNGKPISGDDILDQIRDTAGESYIPKVLQKAGYDGITHIGGAITRNAPHRVWIAFDESQVHPIDTDLIKIERRSLDYTPPKAGIETARVLPAVRLAQRMELIHNLVGQSTEPYAMVQHAGTNGFTIDPAFDGGMTVLRDAESGIVIGNFTSAEKAREFVNASGQAHGVDLTDGGGPGDPPPIGPEGAMPPDGPPPSNLKPFPFRLPGKLETLFDSLNSAVPWIAMKRQYFISLDKLHGTQFFSKVYQPTQVAALKALAVTRELMVPLTKIEKKAKGLSLERRAVIGRYRQTKSPEEIITDLFDRPLNNNEIALAKHFAGVQDGNAVNIDAVYDYLRDAKKLNTEYEKLIQQLEGEAQVAGQQLEPEKIQQQIEKKESEIIQLQELHGLTAKDLEAAKDFELIKRQNLNEMSLYGVTELAKAIMEDRPTRAKFAEENNMTAKELEIAKDFDDLYSTLADVFGIDKSRRIDGFMNHYRRHGDMPHVPVEKPLAGRKSATKFLSDLIRSGEIYNYIDDPFHAAAAYIRSGVNGRVLNQVWADARIAAKGEISKMPAGAQQQARNILDEYFNEIKGIPGASDNAMQVAFDAFMKKLGINTSRKVRGDIVNGILSTIGSALLGFKPELGLRDIGSWFGIHGSRFGYNRSLRALRYAFEKDENGISVADKMLREGHFPGLSPIGVQSAAELAAIEHGTGIGGRIAKFGETMGEAGLKVSLQKNFYAKMHTGAYLESSRLATKVLKDFRDGKITREQAYDRMGLHTYENPVAKHFDELVVNDKDADAAHFIGLATAIETNFFHGLSNHPYKWGTNVGRIAGQFGQWSMFSRDYLVRLASRGTPAQRAAAVGRFALNYAAIHGVGRLLGFNMRAWQILPGLAFTGGPMVQVMADNLAMTGALGSRKQKEAIGMFWNQHTSVGGFRSMFAPGTYAFHDIMEAYAASQDGYGLIPVVGRGMGFKIDYTQRSFIDEYLGNYPKIRHEKPLTTYLADKIDKTFR